MNVRQVKDILETIDEDLPVMVYDQEDDTWVEIVDIGAIDAFKHINGVPYKPCVIIW